MVPHLVVSDRVFLLFAIRRASLGDDYPFREACPKCGVEQLFRQDLSGLEILKALEPTKRIFDTKTPSGKTVRFHLMTGRDEQNMVKIKGGDEGRSKGMLMRLELINDKPVDMNAVKMLSLRDRNYLQEQFDLYEGGIDTTLEVECPNCEHLWKREVDVTDVGFFFPTRLKA